MDIPRDWNGIRELDGSDIHDYGDEMDDQRDYAEEEYNRQQAIYEAIEEDAAQWQERYKTDKQRKLYRRLEVIIPR
jgi:hypothetical protein